MGEVDDQNASDRRLLASMAYRPKEHRRLTPIVLAACELRTALAAAVGAPGEAWSVVTNFGHECIAIQLHTESARALTARLLLSPPGARRRR